MNLCKKCKQVITKRDDYNGAYVRDMESDFYHLICYHEHEREIMRNLAIKLEDKVK